MASTDPVAQKPVRFSLRLPHWGWCLLSIVVFSGGGVCTSAWWPYHREQQAVRVIVERGGHVQVKRVCPQWLVWLLGEERVGELEIDLFDRAVQVDLDGSQVTDDDLVQIGGLASLEVLDLNRTKVTDAGIARLNGLSGLKWLRLYRTHVTDAGLAHLTGLKNLERLNLLGTQVTDAGLVHLSGLAKLETVDLNDTQVSSDGIRFLKRALPQCHVWR